MQRWKLTRLTATLLALFAVQSLAGEASQAQRCPPPSEACIVAIGDSTMLGVSYFAANFISPANATRTLQAILGLQPRGHLMRLGKDLGRARVLNFAVAGSTSGDWVDTPRPALCATKFPDGAESRAPGITLLRESCAKGGGMVDKLAAAVGRVPDIVLVTLGANDKGTATETVDHLVRIGDQLSSAYVLFSSPFRATKTEVQTRNELITVELQERKMLTGPNFNAHPFRVVDGVHLNEEAYAASAGLWLGALQSLPR